jgi:DNA-binding HxlR family transcriptional regulator
MPQSYGQFCPVAKAAEIVAERWTPLILRELLAGSIRFNELQAGLPRISRALLVTRLRELERAGIVERRVEGRAVAYYPTPAGRELEPIITQLGTWGQRWINLSVEPNELDISLLMWDMRRNIRRDLLPTRKIAVQFDFTGARTESWWLLLEPHDVSVCLQEPGFDLDLLVTADTLALHRIWIGHLSLAAALGDGSVRLDGPTDLVRAFPRWLALSPFATVRPAAPARTPSDDNAAPAIHGA